MSAPLLLQGNALYLPLRDASMHCVVTSPPYFGLRDYGTATWVGGAEDCLHTRVGTSADRPRSGLQGGLDTVNRAQEPQWRTICGRCGATRVDAQLGLEGTLEAYLAALVAVFREVHRVLRPDGTCWIVIGDSYNAAGRNGHGTRIGYKQGTNRASATGQDWCRSSEGTLKEKDLCMVPARLALALQADGWYLRSAITWCKTAPMPESVHDRPTSATEMVYLFSKAPTYFYDATAVRVQSGNGWHGSSFQSTHDVATKAGLGQQPRLEHPGRNVWNYWVLGPEPTSNGHYASFPSALVERCILAGTSAHGCCAACGAPWRRLVEVCTSWRASAYPGDQAYTAVNRTARAHSGGMSRNTYTETNWQPSCTCDAPVRPCTILDPFCGSGTTLLVARELGRRSVGLDLSYPYLHEIARQRLGLTALARWEGRNGHTPAPPDYTALPLFAGGAS